MKRKLWRVAALLLLVAILLPGGMRPARADDPPPQAALRYVAQTYGANPADLQIVGQGLTRYPLTGQTIWRGEIYDRRTRQPYAVCVDAHGQVVDLALVQAQEWAARTARYGKLEPTLYEQLQSKTDSDPVRVLVWLAPVDHAAIQVELARQFPDAGFAQGHPTRPTSEARSAEMRRAKHALLRQAHAQREQPVVEYLQRQGLKVVHASPYAPLLVVELPKGALPALAQRDDVLVLYRVFEMRNELDDVASTVHAPVVWMQGITGNGIKVGIVEDFDFIDGVIDFRNPYLVGGPGSIRPGPDFTYSDYAEHATEVAGVVASTHAQFRGIASGVTLLSAPANVSNNDNYNDDGDAITASDWALDQDAHVLNCSFVTGDDGQMHGLDFYYDYIVRYSNVTVVKSAGNRDLTYNPDWYVTTPGLGWNVITVGAFDDHGDGDWTGDTMWPDSCYVDPVYSRVKPEVVAPGVSVRTTEPTDYHDLTGEWISSEVYAQGNTGTSLAAPVVSGEAALLMERDGTGELRDWGPEAVKAIIMASALHDVEEHSTDRDGVGGVDCARADQGVRWGQWFRWGAYYPGSYDDDWLIQRGTFHAYAGDRVRVVICWLSNPPDYGSDSLDTNLSLYVMSPSWTTVGTSANPNDAFEMVDFVASQTGTYTICVWRDPSSTESYNIIGGAWAFKPPATAVTLHSFTATPTGSAIGLVWETANEIDSLGFNVYRAASLDGPLTQLNNSLIPGQSSGSPMGAVYTYLDETVALGIMTYYWLEAVDVSGAVTRYGPVSVVVQSGTGYRIYLPLASK